MTQTRTTESPNHVPQTMLHVTKLAVGVQHMVHHAFASQQRIEFVYRSARRRKALATAGSQDNHDRKLGHEFFKG